MSVDDAVAMDYERFARNGLILARDVLPYIPSHRHLRRDVEHGRLVRVRRGAYVSVELWNQLDAPARHLIRIRAVAADAERPPVFARHSAAVLWGMPLWTIPDDVTLVDAWRGGGRSESAVRRTARGARSLHLVEREGLMCTDLARTALQVAGVLPFEQAVGCLDWALWRANPHAVVTADLVADLQALGSSPHLSQVLAFATDLSGSLGESESRAVIHQLGFPPPQLQVRFVDEVGAMETDFHWPEYGVAAEFDGKVKYSRQQFSRGDPVEVLWREKKREDRLRIHVRTVVRIITADVRQPAVLAKKLMDAGVPRSWRE